MSSSCDRKNRGGIPGTEAAEVRFVSTVCDRAAKRGMPAWPGQPVSAHWGMPDPVKVEGTHAQKSLSFQQAYGALLNRIKVFTALPFASLDRISLQKAVDDIGSASTTTPA